MSEATPFGLQLKGWRKARAKSQLELSGLVGYSQRHLSFLESGRANPSRTSVLALCDALDVPLRERNRLLTAAGFAPAYPNRPLDAPELEDVIGNVKAMIDRQADQEIAMVTGQINARREQQKMQVTQAAQQQSSAWLGVGDWRGRS